MNDIDKLVQKAKEIRFSTLDMCVRAGTGHVTSSMSCADLLVALYFGGILKHDPSNPEWKERDRLFISKAQASPVFYTILADRGFFDRALLDKFAQKGGKFGVHLQGDVPGSEMTCGSLGQGFGMAAGVALAAKMNRELFITYSLLGDGECYEGSIWETAMFASHYRLNNLVAIVDRNSLCVTDFTENIVALEPMEDKWASFGWDVARIDGHDFVQIMDVLDGISSRRSTRPLVVIADTIKGKGIEFMTNIPLWHGLAPKGDDSKRAYAELEDFNERS